MDPIKITALPPIGNSIPGNTLTPVVNMTGTPTTQKATIANIANSILSQAGNLYTSARLANLANFAGEAGSVSNAMQPNITSVGVMANLTVEGLVNLGSIGNIIITGGDNGYVLQTDGTGNLTWTAQTGGGGGNGSPGGSNTEIQFNDAGSFGGNAGFTFNKVAGALASPKIDTADLYHLAGVTIENADLTHGATSALIIPGNGNTSVPAQLTNTYGNVVVTTGINSGSLKNWTFGTDGSLTTPNNSNIYPAGNNFNVYAPAAGAIQFYTDGGNFNWAFDGYGVMNLPFASAMSNTALIYSAGNLRLDAGANNFVFTDTGTVIFPTMTVDLHNGGNQYAQTLQFGDDTQQAVITGPTPSANINAQRLIIQGQRGNGQFSEGGDVYVWAGDAELYGGDIKIYAGDADDNADGYGGYVNIDGGLGVTEGGHVAITGGQSTGGPGGYAEIYAGQGTTHGGNLTLGAGYGTSGPGGTVTIQGGGSGNGLSAYGNVGISAGASFWTFDNAGNLTLPANTFAVNYANGVQVSIGGGSGNTGNVTFDNNIVIGTGDEFGGGGLYLAPGNGSIANSAVQYLRVRGGDYPTHIHLDTGNNEYYDQYFGADSRYVKLEANGNVVINADDYAGNSGTWSFTTDGNLILADGNSVIQSIANSSLDPLNPNVSTMVLTPDPSYSSQALVLDPTSVGHIHLRSPGSNIDQPSANLFLGGEASSFEVGQYNGAVPNLFIHSNNYTWTFDIDGNLTLPQLTTISDESGIGTTLTVGVPPTVIVISGADFSAVNTTYTKTGATTPTWEPAGYNPATDPYIEFTGGEYGIFVPSFGQSLYVNTGTLNVPLTQWNTNPPLGSVAPTAVYTYGASGPDWVFGDDGLLTLPGGNVTIGSVLGGEAILASNTPFGVVSQGNGSTVLQWIDDIANATALSAIYINSPSGNTGDVAVLTGEPGANANIWTFGSDGNLTVPSNIIMAPNSSLIGSGASPAPSINGFSSISSITLSASGNITGGNISTTGQIKSTQTGNLSDGGGQLYLNGSGNNRIDFNTNGTGAPTFTTRSAGAKVVLYPSIGASATDYAMGVDSGTLWLGIPSADGGQFFKWYGGTTELANLSGTGILNVTGNISGGNVVSANTFKSTVVAFSALPAATTPGLRAFINDANLVPIGNFGNVVGGGGSNTVCVWSDGTDWRIG